MLNCRSHISDKVLQEYLQKSSELRRSSIELQETAARTLASFDNITDESGSVPFKTKAIEINEITDSMIRYIEQLKARVITCSMQGEPTGEGYEQYLDSDKRTCIDLLSERGREMVNNLDENQNNTVLLVGSEPQSPISTPWSANELKELLIAYRDVLKKTEVADTKGNVYILTDDVMASLDSAYNFSDYYDEHLELMVNWETGNFYQAPLIVDIIKLSELETAVVNAQNTVLSFLVEKAAGH